MASPSIMDNHDKIMRKVFKLANGRGELKRLLGKPPPQPGAMPDGNGRVR